MLTNFLGHRLSLNGAEKNSQINWALSNNVFVAPEKKGVAWARIEIHRLQAAFSRPSQRLVVKIIAIIYGRSAISKSCLSLNTISFHKVCTKNPELQMKIWEKSNFLKVIETVKCWLGFKLNSCPSFSILPGWVSNTIA